MSVVRLLLLHTLQGISILSLVYDFSLSVCNSSKVNGRCSYTKYATLISSLLVVIYGKNPSQDRQAQRGVSESSAKMRRQRIKCYQRNQYLSHGKYKSTCFKKGSRTKKLVSKMTCEVDSTHRVLIFTRKKWQITRGSTSQYFKKAS